MVSGNVFTPKKLMTFGYDVSRFFPPLSGGRAEFRLVSEDGGVVTHHQRMITPWIIANRSVFPTTYHKHSEEGVTGAYTLIRSGTGNDAIVEANVEQIGDDEEASFHLFWVNCVPITDTLCRVRLAIHADLGGSLPGPLRSTIAKKQAGFVE